MTLLHPRVHQALELHALEYDVLACDPELADTAAFCAHYGFALDESANTILVASKKVEPMKVAACVALGTTRLDVNRQVTALLGVKRASFADPELTVSLTEMMIGGVTAIGIESMPVFIDAEVMNRSRVVMGGGNRSSKVVLDPRQLLRLPGVQVVESLATARDVTG